MSFASMKKTLNLILVSILILSCNKQTKNMEQKIQKFYIIGISVETTNENGKSENDMGELWGRFYKENISSKIPNKVSDEIYSIYTDYESDYRGKQTALIGQKVHSLDEIPYGLMGREFNGGKYVKFIAKGEMPNAVIKTWKKIWNRENELNREYSADFEVYGVKSHNGDDSEVEIYIATN